MNIVATTEKTGLQKVIELAQRLSPELSYNGCFGATRGQILRLDDTNHLDLRPCWFSIHTGLTADHIILRPLMFHLTDQLAKEPVLSDDFLALITNERYSFGGETIEFKHPYHSHINLKYPITEQIMSPENMRIVYNKTWQQVCESESGEIIIRTKDAFFQMQNQTASFTNEFDCLIREYAGPSPWTEFFPEDTEEIRSTGFLKQVVPTLWIKNPNHYEFFLEFSSNWRHKSAKKVAGAVGRHVVKHKLSYGKIFTRTSLRITDSQFYQKSANP